MTGPRNGAGGLPVRAGAERVRPTGTTPPPETGPDIPVPGPRPVVWAPYARVIEVVLPQDDGGQERLPLRLLGSTHPGYWAGDTELAAGTDYGFSIDGGELVPDPRGVWLPGGIHGPTRVFDPGEFGWTDGVWTPPDLGAGVLLHVDVATFTPEGTLDAAAGLLPAVADLGIQCVELAPVASFDPDRGREAGVRLYSVHEAYGGPRALQRFVDTAHDNGIAVVLDVPYRWAVSEDLALHRFGPYAVGSPSPRGQAPVRPGPHPADSPASRAALADDGVAAMKPRTGQIPVVRPRTGQVPVVRGRTGALPTAPTVRTDTSFDPATPRINLDGSGSRGPRDFLVDDAKHWFTEYHVDGVVLDVEALTDRSQVPLVAALADEVVMIGEASRRRLSLLIDGPGRSDRLTSLAYRLMSAPGSARDIEDLRALAELISPAVRRNVRQAPTGRLAQHAGRRGGPRAGAAVVENLTRLPGATLTTPWPDPHSPARGLLEIDDLDVRASLLATTILAGTPVVLDTLHVPVVCHTERDRRLASWARDLIKIRHDSADELELPLEIRGAAENTVVIFRRGKAALVVNAGHGLAALRLSTVLRPAEGDLVSPPPSAYRLVAAWEPGATRLVGDTLTVPGRMTALLRAD